MWNIPIFKDFWTALKNKYNSSIYESYYIVSLGHCCYPKTVLTRRKLKRLKVQGEISLPFDFIWVHQANFITNYIENNFNDFFSDLKYISGIRAWDSFRKINFSHEKDFGPNDKNKLIEMYTRRISNFNKILNSEKPILFVQFLKEKNIGEDVENLYNVLLKKRQGKYFHLLIIDCCDIASFTNEKVTILKLEAPPKDVNLYASSFYHSNKGKSFDKKIIKQCEFIIKNKLHKKVIHYL